MIKPTRFIAFGLILLVACKQQSGFDENTTEADALWVRPSYEELEQAIILINSWNIFDQQVDNIVPDLIDGIIQTFSKTE
ncbi:MAG: hypothetical protein Tsb0034_09140 [Ekhidna sp.]